MYNGIGLRTVRGSGTNGYVQTNRAHVKAINVRTATELNRGGLNKEAAWKAERAGAGNAEIQDHNAKRAVEARRKRIEETKEETVREEAAGGEHQEAKANMNEEVDGILASPRL